MKKTLAIFSVAILSIASLFADYNQAGIPDSAEIRRQITDEWLTSSLGHLRSKNTEQHVNAIGTSFEIRLEENKDDFQILVTPESLVNIDYIDGSRRLTQKSSRYLRGSAGSWILYREKSAGNPKKIEWYINPDSDIYVQLRPSESKTYADLIICGYYAARSVPLGISFASLYDMSFQDLYTLTKKSFPWYKVSVNKENNLVYTMAAMIEKKLSSIDYAKDAVYNEKGDLYNLFTGQPYEKKELEDKSFYRDSSLESQEEKNSRVTLGEEGFIKWIADGIIRPVTGKGTSISKMLAPTVDYDPLGKNGVLLTSKNITLSLDWCRNLATEVLCKKSNKSYTFETGGIDVRDQPFVAKVMDFGKARNTAGYVKGNGYSIDEIKGLLYVLACSDPGWFYLGAIRQTSLQDTNVMPFNKCAAFFPYFDQNGKFVCRIFEQGREITLENFLNTYNKCFVHFERVRATEYFIPDLQ